MLWLFAGLAYAVACAAVTFLVLRGRHAVADARAPRPSIDDVQRDVNELRSLVLEAIADASQQGRRATQGWLSARDRIGEIERRMAPVEAGVEYLRTRSEQQQFDEWVAAGAIGDPAVEDR